MSKCTINIGILGSASIAKRSVIPALKELKEFNILGIASRSLEKAQEFAEEFNTVAYKSYEELLSLSDLDAVYIPLPNALQYEWIKKALLLNLNVLVEKSMCCDFYQVKELNELAHEKKLVLIENFQFRFHKQLETIKKLLKEGTIGELRNMRSSFGFPPFQDQDNFRYKKALGGGAIYDVGAYPLKISQQILGEALYVDSASLSIDDYKGIDIYGSAYLKDKNSNVTSQIAFGFDHFYQCNIELWGTEGKLYTNRVFTAPVNYQSIIEIETVNGKKEIKVENDNHFKNMLQHFYKCIVSPTDLDYEYSQNITQARLINELKEKAHG